MMKHLSARMMTMLPSGLLATLLLVCGVPLTAAEIGVRLPSKTDINTLTDLVVKVTGISIQYNPTKIRGEVKLDIQDTHDAAGIWRIYNTVLLSQGLTTVVHGDPPVYHLAPVADAAKVVAVTDPAVLDALRFMPGYVSVIHDLNQLTAEDATKAATAVLGGQQSAQVKVLGNEGGSLVITGPGDQVAMVRQVLQRLDRDGLRPGLAHYEPQRAATSGLMTAVNAAWTAQERLRGHTSRVELQVAPDGNRLLVIAPEEQLPGILALLEELDLQQPQLTRQYSPQYFTVQEVADLLEKLLAGSVAEGNRASYDIVVDELTDQLIVRAPERIHEQVAAVMARLAQVPQGKQRTVRSFVVRHRPAEEVAAVVRKIIDAGGATLPAEASPDQAPGQTAEADTGAADAAAPATALGQSERDEVVLTTDSGTNSILVTASSQQMARVESLLEELDRRQAQVAIDVILVGLSDTQARTLGVELARQWEDDGTSLNLASLFGLSSAADGGGLPDRVVDNPSGFTSLLIKPGDYGVLLRALENITDGTSLTHATSVVNNNAEATINSVRQEPIASINASSTVATSTFSGTSDAGTIVSLKPTISAGDYITLAYSVEQSQFLGESTVTDEGATVPPPKQQDTMASTAHVPDGHVIALGGLVADRTSSSTSQIPWLGRIPFLGWMFKNTNKSERHSYQYVFIRIDILRHEHFEGLKHLSAPLLEEAGIDDGWPDLEARFIR